MLELKDYLPLLEHIVSFIEEGVLISDEAGTVEYHNPSACELLGFSPSTPITHLSDLQEVSFRKNLLKASLLSGDGDAAARPSGQFVKFTQRVTTEQGLKHIEFHSGMVTLSEGRSRRLTLMTDRTEHTRLRAVLNLESDHEFVTRDPGMLSILARIQQIAGTQASSLLQGESGTGKTQLARMVHKLSARSEGPFVEVNCAAIPESLLESELYGHVKGAFTGAHQSRAGRFQTAHKGTLFLDEISEIPLHLQAKLLRSIQDQAFEPVGSDTTQQVDVRIIAASNHRLRDWVEDGRFRADLYYRLAVIPLDIPPLRKRKGDLPLLVEHFLARLAQRGYPDKLKLDTESKRLIMNYPWPGNVRELENAIEHGVICATGPEIDVAALPRDIQKSQDRSLLALADDDDEAAAISQALKQANGNRSLAANILGIDRSTLWRKINRYGLKDPSS